MKKYLLLRPEMTVAGNGTKLPTVLRVRRKRSAAFLNYYFIGHF